MPNSLSAKKRLRQNEKRRIRNRSAKRAMKTQMKKVFKAVEANDNEAISTEYNLAAQSLDRAAAKRLIHPNLAARKKSQLAQLLNQAAGSKEEE